MISDHDTKLGNDSLLLAQRNGEIASYRSSDFKKEWYLKADADSEVVQLLICEDRTKLYSIDDNLFIRQFSKNARSGRFDQSMLKQKQLKAQGLEGDIKVRKMLLNEHGNMKCLLIQLNNQVFIENINRNGEFQSGLNLGN